MTQTCILNYSSKKIIYFNCILFKDLLYLNHYVSVAKSTSNTQLYLVHCARSSKSTFSPHYINNQQPIPYLICMHDIRVEHLKKVSPVFVKRVHVSTLNYVYR